MLRDRLRVAAALVLMLAGLAGGCSGNPAAGPAEPTTVEIEWPDGAPAEDGGVDSKHDGGPAVRAAGCGEPQASTFGSDFGRDRPPAACAP